MVIGGPCTQCGKPVERRWEHELAPARFCNNVCKFAYQRIHPTHRLDRRREQSCSVCGKNFGYYPSVRPNAQYCSRRCKGIGHATTMTGRRPSKGVYTSRATFRTMIRREFVDRCAICGWDEAPNDVAHIHARKHGGIDAMDNVVMLCPNHHRLFDRRTISVQTVLAARPNCLRHALNTPASTSS